jgi:hypothetical protein
MRTMIRSTNSCIDYTTLHTNNTSYLTRASSTDANTPWLPNDRCVPVSIRETSTDCWEVTAPPALPEYPERPLIAQTFQEYIQHLPDSEQHVLAYVHLLYEPYELLNLFNAKPVQEPNDDSTCTNSAPNLPSNIHTYHPPFIWYPMDQNWLQK